MNTEIQEALRKLEQAKALLQGALAGKVIEPINRTDKDWEVIEVLLHPEEYRLKPVPRRIWVNRYASHDDVFGDEQTAKSKANSGALYIAIPFIEVID